MSDTLLTTVQDFCGENNLPIPSAVMGVTETSVVQYRAMMKRLMVMLSQYSWQQLIYRKTWVSIADENQGALTTLIGTDYRGIIQNTVWNDNEDSPVFGPLTQAAYAMLKSSPAVGPLYQYTIFQDTFRLVPAPPAGLNFSLMYRSAWGITSNTGVPKAAFTADDDLIQYPDVVVAKGLEYLWKRAKGEDWETSFGEYMALISKNLGKDTLPILFLDQPSMNLRPGIWVPAGSWPV